MLTRGWIRVLLAAALLLGLAGAGQAAEGKLGRIKDGVKDDDDDHRGGGRHGGGGRGGNSGSHRSERDDDDDDDEDDLLAELILEPALEVTLWVLASPFWGPAVLLGDRPGFPGRPYRFENYPYADGTAGLVRRAGRLRPTPGHEEAGEDDAPRDRWKPVRGSEAAMSTLLSYERHSDGIQGFRGEVQLRTCSRFNLDLSATDYAEQVGGETDHLGHFKGHVTYSFAVSRHALFSAGIGARVLSWEGGGSYGGVDFRYEAEFFPIRPLHLHCIAEAGWVRDETVWELEGRVGVLFKPAEIFAGYRHFHVAGEDLAGPTAGLIVWF
jgi:hypothetical protein